jgi:hypothetical protein
LSRLEELCRAIGLVWPRLLLIAPTLVILFYTPPANAAMLRCASHQLASGERDEIMDRARHLVPGGGRALAIKSACSNRDFAIAWLRTPKGVDLEDVHWWWAMRCDRKTRSWSCAPATRERRIEVVIADAAQPATVVGSFPDAISAARARTIITTTATLAMKADMPLPACSVGSDDVVRWRRSRFNPPAPDLEYPAAEVDIGNDGPMVDYGSLRFSLGTDDRPLCWDELIIVD